jgi:hypothetical protein
MMLTTSFSDRFAASFKALGATWFVSGLIFCFVIKGPGTISAWIIWGTAVFIAGWIVVGLPLIALSDRIFRFHVVLVAGLSGLGGGLLMLAPNVLVRVLEPQAHFEVFATNQLGWPGVAFVIAASTTALYRVLLYRVRSAGLRP